MKHASRPSRLAAFTIAAWLALPALVAQADRVVLYPIGGDAEPELTEDIEDHVTSVLRALGHEVVGAPGGISATRPQTAAQMGGVATAAGADWVLVIDVEPLRGQYNMHVFAGYQATQRVEELTVGVMLADEEARLRDVLSAMLRPEGLGEDALRLTGEETEEDRARREAEEARLREEAEAQRRREEEEARRLEEEEAERARREAEEQAQQEAAEAAARAQAAWDARPRYGSDGHWMLSVGGGGLAAIGLGEVRQAGGASATPTGGLGLVQARVAHQLEGVEGFEIRGGIDVFLGLTNGLDIVVGAAYLFSPFVEPIYIGAVIDLGLAIGFTGARDVGFVTRASAIVAFRPTDHFQIEVVLPELGVMTNGVGSFLVGGAARLGYRF